MYKKNRKFIDSLCNSINGIGHSISKERNLRFHLCAAFCVILLGVYFNVNIYDFIFLIMAITLVIVCELFNTAIERTVDLSCNKYHPLAKIAKDVASGAVLIAAIGSAIIGLLIFYKYLIKNI